MHFTNASHMSIIIIIDTATMVKHTLRVKLTEKRVCRTAKWRSQVKEEDPDKWYQIKAKDAERKKAEYAMLKEKRSKGNREARSKLMEKRERQKETQKMYRMRKREQKAAASNVESPAAVDAIESPPAAAAATTQNESTSQSGISTPHSVSFSSPQLSTSTPKVVPSTLKPGTEKCDQCY